MQEPASMNDKAQDPDAKPTTRSAAELTGEPRPAISEPGPRPTEGQPANGETMSAAEQIAQLKQERDEFRDQALRAGPSSPIIRSAPSSRPTPIGSTPSARWRSDLLDPLDNLDRAIEALRAKGALGVTAGLDMVQKQLHEILAKHGVEPIPAQGHPFDPNLHDAVLQQPSLEHPEGTVVAETEQGLHDPRPRAAAQQGRGFRQAGRERRVNDMPTYDYICDSCGHEFEAYESIMAQSTHRVPRVQAPQAAPQDRPGRGDPFQGIRVLPDRLSQRFVQEGGKGRKDRRASRRSRRPNRSRRPSHPARPRASRPRPRRPRPRASHDPRTLPNLFQDLRDRRDRRPPFLSRSAPTAAGLSTWAAGSTARTRSPGRPRTRSSKKMETSRPRTTWSDNSRSPCI